MLFSQPYNLKLLYKFVSDRTFLWKAPFYTNAPQKRRLEALACPLQCPAALGSLVRPPSAGPVLRYFTHRTRNTGNWSRGWGRRRGRISMQQGVPRGAVSLQPRIPGHLQEARIMDTSPGERYSGYLGHDVSSLKRLSQEPRSKPNQQWRGGPHTVRQGHARSPLRATGFCGNPSAVQCELPKNPLLMSRPIPTHTSKHYFSHTWLKDQQECYLSL